MSSTPEAAPPAPTLERRIGRLDATALVVGSMIGSGIFIVSAESARLVGTPGRLLLTWVVAGALTVAASLSCAELSAMLPRAGGQYVFFREAYGPLAGFLFGWTMLLVIQTGTIAAVAVAFARFLGVLVPAFSPVAFEAVRSAITARATSCTAEIEIGPADTQGVLETAGTRTPRNRANATATAAIVPVWITRSIVQPKRNPASGP